MKKAGLIILALSLLISCQNDKKKDSYEINGIVKNIPDSSVVLISANNKYIDSTIVLGEKFQLTGKVEKPINVYLTIKNTRDYKSFWLENNKINFIAEKGKFSESKITGSETQKDDDLLSKRLNTVQREMDSLESLYDESASESFKDSLWEKYELIEKKEFVAYQDFIKEYPNSLVSSHVLNIYKTTWGKEICSELFSLMNEEIQKSENGKSIARFIKLNKNPQIGDKYVDFEQENMLGQKIKLSDIKGKYILVEFWASWCGPCRRSNPNLVDEYEKYKNQGFEIIGVSLDLDKSSWIRAIEKDGLIWENVSDLKGDENEAGLIYGVNGIPDNFLINENGIIIGRTLSGDNLKNKLAELFGEKTSL